MDAISWLPEEVQGKILSLLPTEEAASTSILCKKWRNVYRLVDSLDFDDSALGLDKLEWDVLRVPDDDGGYILLSLRRYVFPESFKKFVDTTLALQGDYPIKKFSLKCNTGGAFNESHKACVTRWIAKVVERGVLELDLRIKRGSKHLVLFKSKTLVKLTLGTRIRLGKLPWDLSLPCLKTLFIDTVWFEEAEDFSGVLLAGCPVLEELSSVHQKGFDGTPPNISSPSVKRVLVDYDSDFVYGRSLYLSLNLPNLVYLDYSDFAFATYRQVNLESLVEAKLDLGLSKAQVLPDLTPVFWGIRNVEILHLSPVSAHVIHGNCRYKLPMLNNLVKLSFGSKRKRGWKLLRQLLKQSPKLETLIIQELNDNICDDVLMHLKKLKVLHILSYRGTGRELRLLKSFLWNTQGLELVQVVVTAKDESIIVETKSHLMIIFGDYCDITVSKA